MNLILLSKKLIAYWYPDSLAVFMRILRNSIYLLEEDLAVRLMLKLLFVPLFHDSSIVGRLLSFLFRFTRIFLGIFAFVLVAVIIFLLAIYWFTLPVLAIILGGTIGLATKGSLLFGFLLFIYHLFAHPAKKVWQVNPDKIEVKSEQEIWDCSLVSQTKAQWDNLLKTKQVQSLLLYLEKKPDDFTGMVLGSVAGSGVLKQSLELGKNLSAPYLGPEHFFVAALLGVPNIEGQLAKLGLSSGDLIAALGFLNKRSHYQKFAHVWDDDFQIKHLKGINRGWLGAPTPALDAASEDLTKIAAKENIVDFVGRPTVVSQVVNILSLEKGRNVVIVGEPGSGRSALVKYLAKVIVSGDAPPSLATKRLVSLDLTKLLTGVKTQGELAEKVKDIFEEVKFSGNVVVFVDEIQNLGIGEAASQFNLYSLMLPFIESSDFQFIASTESTNFTRILEKNGAFARLFTKIELPPASPEETIEILKNKSLEEESSHKVSTSLLAIKEISKLTTQYIHDRVLPDSALQILAQCQAQPEGGWVKKSVVDKVFGDSVNVPVGEVEESKKQELLNLEGIIHRQFIDQEEAVSVVANTLRRAAVSLREQNRPIGSFLFVGPTGVGKTELAKILSQVYFQGRPARNASSTSNASRSDADWHSDAGGGNFLRLDMSEYQTAESINRLIGSSSEDGILTETIRLKPYTLILLDEFEKADSKVLTIFLQVLDDGRLTSGSGRTVDFTNTIIIATSNAGSLTIARGLQSGQTLAEVKKTVDDELLQTFKPELINRFDEVVLFKPLAPVDLQKIVRLKLAALQKQLTNQGFNVDFDDGLVSKLAEKGFDVVLGARPLRRLIQDTIEARLSVMILEDKLPKGEKFLADEKLLA